MNDYIKEAQALIKEHGLTKEAWLPSFFRDYLRGFKEPKPGGASQQFPAPYSIEELKRQGLAKTVHKAPTPPTSDYIKGRHELNQKAKESGIQYINW